MTNEEKQVILDKLVSFRYGWESEPLTEEELMYLSNLMEVK